jgi:nitroimidazol reductase NimA-like FMN-containing flavoprotein (pyridoxamine 5'-phosphate oxidase superfamily)
MTEDERQAFLAGVHIGMISIERQDGPPLTVPIWYGYEPGGNIWVTTGTDSLKSKLLHKAQRFSLCVQTEEAPFYSYVSVDGPVVSVEPTDEEGVLRPMAHRYFGAELGDLYVESIKGGSSLTWTMRPERWWSVDYSKTGRVDPRTPNERAHDHRCSKSKTPSDDNPAHTRRTGAIGARAIRRPRD